MLFVWLVDCWVWLFWLVFAALVLFGLLDVCFVVVYWFGFLFTWFVLRVFVYITYLLFVCGFCSLGLIALLVILLALRGCV